MKPFADIVRETVASAPGTGSSVALGGAVAGFRTFAQALAAGDIEDGQIVHCVLESDYVSGLPTKRETSTFVYDQAGNQLTGRSVLSSNNSGAAISAGTDAQVFLAILTSDIRSRLVIEVTTGASPITIDTVEDFTLVLVTSGGTQGVEELIIPGFTNADTADYTQENNGRTVVVKVVALTDPADVVHVLPHDYNGDSYASSQIGGYWEFFTLDFLGSAVTLVWMEYWWTVPLYGAYDQSNEGVGATDLINFRNYGSGITVDLSNTSLNFLNKSIFFNESSGGALSTYRLPTNDYFTAKGATSGVGFSFLTVDAGGMQIEFEAGDINSQIRFAGVITPTGGGGKLKTDDVGARIELAMVGGFASGPGTVKWAVIAAVGSWRVE